LCHIAGAIDAGDNLFTGVNELALMVYLWARGILIHEKNQKLKISCETLFQI
jgi:hypothetical protein